MEASYLFRSLTFPRQCWFFGGDQTFNPRADVSCTSRRAAASPWPSRGLHLLPGLNYPSTVGQLLVVFLGLLMDPEVFPSQISNSRSGLDRNPESARC